MELPENIRLLIEKYIAGQITADEKVILDKWYQSFDDTESELIVNEDEAEQQLKDRIKSRLLETIHKDEDVEMKPRRNWRKFSVAASVIVILFSVSGYFILTPKSAKQEIAKTAPAEKKVENEIVPGGNKAVLTLADGSTIILDSASTGTIIQQGNIKVQKLKNGLVAYLINNKQVTKNDKAFYNTISTPRGGQYQITLADGTKVWLNAASSIRFPIVFTGNERKVTITGEAYFEVAKNKEMPFKVKAGATETEVLGTHFNINAYDDEPSVKTTLLEGKVKITVPALVPNQSAGFLMPGEQAQINKSGKIKVITDADTELAVAWMRGYFQFKSADIKSILRQISRWYDADVVYNGNIDVHFSGQLDKNLDVSTVFKTLSLTNEVTFRTEGKKIIVSPKK